MSVDDQVLGAPDGDIANVDASKTDNPGLEDVDLYGASASGIANTSASSSSLVRETVSNTRSNAQRPPEHLRTVEPTFVNENAGDIPFVHSPLLLPSQDMPLEVPSNGNAIAANNPSSRKNAIASQRSDLRQEAKAGHPRRNSDKTSTSSPSRKESSSRRDSGRPESAHPDAPPSRHFLEHQPNESQSYSRNIHEDSRHHTSHRRSSHSAPAIPANPYAGAGLYPTPPMYASPLSIPQYGLPPPIGHSHTYPPTIPIYPTSRISSITPTVPTQPLPASRQSLSSNIVAAVALTPETKSLKSIAGPSTLLEAGSFADNNPYRLRNRQGGSTPDFQDPYYYDSSARRPRRHTWVDPSLTPQVVYPGTPYSASAPNGQYYDHNQRNHYLQQGAYYDYYRQKPEPYYYDDYAYPPRVPITSAGVVSATSNMPIPEKRKTQSSTVNEPYDVPGSSARRNTATSNTETKRTGSFAEHNPYRIPSRKATLDNSPTDSLPPSHPLPPPPRPSPPRRPSVPSGASYGLYSGYRRSPSNSRYNDYYVASSPRRSSRYDDWESETYRPSRRSPSPEYQRRRQRRRSYSPFKYSAPPLVPGAPYRTPLSSFDVMVPLDPRVQRHYYMRKPPGYWSRFTNFFKSPFERGRPTSFHHPYPRGITEEPTTLSFIVTVIVGQAYFHLLLRLPSLYFSRVSRIFDEANLNILEITEMAFETSEGSSPKEKAQAAMNMQVSEPVAPKIRPQYERLKSSWEAFIDSLIREWETFNIVSVMLLTAILTILQITTAASDPVTRYAALFSLICSLISLLFGCMYIIRFGTMRKTYAAVEWAKAVLDSSQSVIWNVWVLLCMPAVWLTWSIILFIVAIMSFVWRTNPANDSASTFILSSTGLLVVRIAISAVLALGVMNTILITNTFRIYGEALDKDWRRWIKEWQNAKAVEASTENTTIPQEEYYTPAYPGYTPMPMIPVPSPYLYSGHIPPSPPLPPGLSQNPVYSPYTSRRHHRERSSRRRHRGAHAQPENEGYSTSSESSSQSRRSRRRSRSPDPHRPPSEDPSDRENTSPSHTHWLGKWGHPPPKNLSPGRKSPDGEQINDAQEVRGSNKIHINPYTPNLESEIGEEDPQSRVRFRSPLESTHGSSDWGAAYDSSFDYSSPRIIGPSSSSASGGGITYEANDVQIQNSDALRRRRPTS